MRIFLHGLLTLLTCLATGCIDKEPGLAAELRSATVTITGAGADAVVAVELRAHVRVGKYALEGRNFITQRANVLAGETLVAEVTLERPADFTGTLEPGDSTSFTLTGATNPGAFPSAVDALCPDMGEARVSVEWQAQLTTTDVESPDSMEFGTFVGPAEVVCP